MKFLDLSKKRRAIKHFNEKPVDKKDVRTAIEIASLSPSAHNIQPWKFVLVDSKKEELADSLPAANKEHGRTWTDYRTDLSGNIETYYNGEKCDYAQHG